jgi:hypothetical protein
MLLPPSLWIVDPCRIGLVRVMYSSLACTTTILHCKNCTNTAVNNQRQPPILHTRLERITLTSPIRHGSTIGKKKGTITYKNINNPHLAIWATRLRGYTHRTNAEQVSIVKIQTDQTRYGGYLNEKPRLHNQDVTKQAIQLNM